MHKLLILMSWLLLLGLSTAQANTVEVPADFGFYLYDADAVAAINRGVSRTITTDTNQLLLQKFSRRVVVQERPFARIDKELAQPGVRCTTDRIKTPQREKQFLFSLPVNFYLGYRLYQRADLAPLPAGLLDATGAVRSLPALMQAEPHSRLLVSSHYSLGEYLDNEIKQVAVRQQIPISTTRYYDQFVGVFLAKRAEYAVLFPTAIYEYFHGDLPMPVRSYPIAGAPQVVAGHLMCNNTAASRQFLRQVDAALLSLYSDQAFIAAHTRYMLPADASTAEQLIKQELNKHLQQTEGSTL